MRPPSTTPSAISQSHTPRHDPSPERVPGHGISSQRFSGIAWLSILLLFSIAPLPLGAQEPEPARLSGIITSADSRIPVADALVELTEAGLRIRTDLRGRFLLTGIPAGTHTVRIIRMGYNRMSDVVQLAPGENRQVEYRLVRSVVEIDPIQVLASRTRLAGQGGDGLPAPGAAHVINRERIASPEFVFGNVHDLLRTVPGVNLQEEDGYGLRPNIGLRGSGTERSSKITLMEDGVLIAPAPYAAPAAYFFPTVSRMEAVEVRTGSSQVRYGPRTTGGALNLVSTSIPEELTWSLDAGGGSESTNRAQGRVGNSGEHVGWLVEGSRVETDGFKHLASGRNTGFLLQDYVAKLRFRTSPGARVYQHLDIKAGYNDERSNETYLGLTDADFRANALQRYPASDPDVMNAEHTQLQIRHFVAARNWDLTTTAYQNNFQRNWFKLQSVLGTDISTVLGDPGAHETALGILKGATSSDDALKVRANNREYVSRGIQSTLGLRVESGPVRHNVELGVRIHEDEEDRFQWEDGFRMLDGQMVQTSAGEPGSQANRVSQADAVALFLQDEVRAGRWTITAGLRHETIDFTRTDFATTDPGRTAPTGVRTNSVSVWIPGVSVAARVAPGVEVFSGVHRGFGPPGPGDNQDTRAERSWNYELGGRLARSGLSAQVTGYITDYSNILGRATLANSGDGEGDAFNGGAVLVRGLEANVEWDVVANRGLPVRIPLTLAYTYTDATFQSDFESDFDSWGSVRRGDQLPHVAASQLYASLAVAGRVGKITASLTGSTPARTQAGQGPRDPLRSVDGFVVASLSGEWHLHRQGTLFAAVQNLTDTRYSVARRPAGLRPGLPRTVLAGFRLGR